MTRKVLYLFLVVLMAGIACTKPAGKTPAITADTAAVRETPIPREAAAPIGWRGDGSGRFPAADPPTVWGEKQNIIWETVLPDEAYSSPIVSQGKVFVTSEPGILGCYDAATGKLLWQASHGIQDIPEALRGKVEEKEYASGNAAQTPTADGLRVYVQMASGIAACYDYAGKRLWITALGIPPVSGDGRSSSPVLAGQVLAAAAGHLFGLDAADGRILWETDKVEEGYGSLLATGVNTDKVVITSTGAVVAAGDGTVLANEIYRLSFATPVIHEQTMYFIESGALAFPLPETAVPYTPGELWADGYSGEFYASPVAHEGLLYAVNNEGIFYIIDAGTGEALVEKPLPIPPSPLSEDGGGGEVSMYASICLAGKHLFICNSIGDTVVLEPGREYKETAVNHLPRDGWSGTPFFEGQRIYFRFGDRLTAVGVETAGRGKQNAD